MRLFTEQTAVQCSLWVDIARSVLATLQSLPSPPGPMSAASNLTDPLDITMEPRDPPDKDLRHASCVMHR